MLSKEARIAVSRDVFQVFFLYRCVPERLCICLPGNFMAKKNDAYWYFLRALNRLLKSSIRDPL